MSCEGNCDLKNSPKLDDKFVLKKITQGLISDECITPNCPPRPTQSTIGLQIVRADGHDLDYSDREHYIYPKILDKWTYDLKGEWVDRPGVDDLTIHDMTRKYLLRYDYNPDKVPKFQLFPRPYCFELDCLNEYRRIGVENAQKKTFKCTHGLENKSKIPEYNEPPFWWKKGEESENEKYICLVRTDVEKPPVGGMEKRWKPLIYVTEIPKRDACERRILMNRVGQPYKCEACKFYHENYPTPDCELTKIKFST